MTDDKTPTLIKSNHALILNRLHEMQAAPYYATARQELSLAESTIVQLERENAALTVQLETECKARIDVTVKLEDATYNLSVERKAREAVDNVLDTYEIKQAPLHDRVFALGQKLEAAEQRLAQAEESVKIWRDDLAQANAKLAAAEHRADANAGEAIRFAEASRRASLLEQRLEAAEQETIEQCAKFYEDWPSGTPGLQDAMRALKRVVAPEALRNTTGRPETDPPTPLDAAAKTGDKNGTS